MCWTISISSTAVLFSSSPKLCISWTQRGSSLITSSFNFIKMFSLSSKAFSFWIERGSSTLSSSFISSLISSSLIDSPQSTKLDWVRGIFVFLLLIFSIWSAVLLCLDSKYYGKIVQNYGNRISDIHHMSKVSLLYAILYDLLSRDFC